MPPDVLNLTAALNRLGGNEQVLNTLVQFFFEDSPQLLAQLRRGVAENDADALRAASHKLNGLSSNFGAQRAVAAARRLEELAIASDWNVLPEAAALLEQEIALVCDALKAGFEGVRR